MRPTYRRAERLLWRDCGTEVLVTVPGDERVHALSGSGALVWDALGATATAADVARAIAEAAGRSPHDLEASIVAFLAELEDRGIVVRVRGRG